MEFYSCTETVVVDKAKAIEIMQRDDVARSGFLDIIYYLPQEDNGEDAGTVCVCLIVDSKDKSALARGVTVRSPLDQMDKRRARIQARGRALRAIRRGSNSSPIVIREDNVDNMALQTASMAFNPKSQFRPNLTQHEKKIVERLRSRII